ncbi:hypothetical protein MTO96_011806 [Rhipicephalus appendiculatus]
MSRRSQGGGGRGGPSAHTDAPPMRAAVGRPLLGWFRAAGRFSRGRPGVADGGAAPPLDLACPPSRGACRAAGRAAGGRGALGRLSAAEPVSVAASANAPAARSN